MSRIARTSARFVRGLTCIELFFFLFFFFGGVYAGDGILSLIVPGHPILGAGLGIVAVFAIMLFLTHLHDRETMRHPSCRCGKNKRRDFRVLRDPDWGLVSQCSCGLRYEMRRGWLWFEILQNNRAVLYMQRNFWGHWILASEKNKAKRTIRQPKGRT